MKLCHALSLIPSDLLAQGLRVNEEAVLNEVKGDIYVLQLAYRLIARVLKGTNPYSPRELIRYQDLPERMKRGDGQMMLWTGVVVKKKTYRLTAGQFSALRERVESMVKEAGEYYLGLRPYDQYEMFQEEDSLEYREARVRYYELQNQEIERRFDLAPDPSCRKGSKKRPVRCVDEDGNTIHQFKSTRKAAEWLRDERGLYVRRSDLRTSIRKGYRCGGMHWLYVEEPKNVSESDQMALFVV